MDDVECIIDAAHAESAAGRWCVGWIAYESAPAFDRGIVGGEHVHALPDGSILAAFAVFDAPTEHTTPVDGDWRADDWREATAADFDTCIADIRSRISDGDFYQVNLTTRLDSTLHGDALAYFRALQLSQPGGYAIHLPHALNGVEERISSVSPELFFDWRNGRVTTQPMKGTAPRGATAGSDAEAGERLRTTPKERAENLMIVDLLRNDLSRAAITGSVRVSRLFELHALPTVWQMTSTVEAHTRPALRLAELCAALFRRGSVTGAPKRAAMAEICRLEKEPRGVYCGALGRRPMPTADEFIRHKTTRRDAYEALVPSPGSGIFDTLLWNADFELTETTIGNIALKIGGRWLTPPVTAGLLPGVYREALLAEGRLAERPLRVEDLQIAKGVAMLNSVRGWIDAEVVSERR